MFGPTFEELELLDSGDHEFTSRRLARYYVERLGPWGPTEAAWIKAFDLNDEAADHDIILKSIRGVQRLMSDRDMNRSEFLMDLFRPDHRLNSDAAFKMFECASQAGLSETLATHPFHEWLVARDGKSAGGSRKA